MVREMRGKWSVASCWLLVAGPAGGGREGRRDKKKAALNIIEGTCKLVFDIYTVYDKLKLNGYSQIMEV